MKSQDKWKNKDHLFFFLDLKRSVYVNKGLNGPAVLKEKI